MNILIIGAKGFIGSYAVEHFSKNHTVWQCDVVVDYVTPNYIQVDATNANYSAVFENQRFDFCINCSGAASVPDSLTNPQRDFTLNTVNVFRQLDAIRKYNPECKYINLSSAAVYGNPEYLPIDELHPLKPISPYGLHKKMAEAICQSFYENFQIKTCSLRIFSAYGAGLQKQLFWDLYKKAKGSSAISLFGTGSETRDFIHVHDVVKAMDCVIKKSAFAHDIVNVANGKELSIKDVAKTFFDIYNPKIEVTFQNQERKGDPSNWVADLSKLHSTYGFDSEMNLQEGLTNYVKWLKGIE
ncbi:MAG: SDR family oxidoreductase [Ignavibacteriae bacterium]|nr:SDR family oxidoreductase [Ignavibacteriota bacterium]MCB0752712.1 SDR family oxidoreductase [Ignavibacteriota bacterium]HPF97439.1 SDR family oxidoreductase [Mangrovimonas sp.]